MIRYVVCLDGTWNNAAREYERTDGSRVYRPTNVLKLARAIRKTDDNRVIQITYYDEGVGAMNRAPNARARVVRFFDNKLGGGWGAGFEVNIEEAYTFLANNYEVGDEIFVFGFSRGASQARSLCQLIDWAGGFPRKSDVYYVPKIFSGYLDARGEGDALGLIEAINAHRAERDDPPLEEFVAAHVVFLGVWDTVLALGSRIMARHGSSRKKYRFHTSSTPPGGIGKIRQALAIDESRHDFQPEIWAGSGDCADFEQRWFAGVHSNVGGGLIDDSLANCALRWMRDEATAAGLAFDPTYLSHFREYAAGAASSKSVFYKAGDALMRPIRGFDGIRRLSAAPGTVLDDSVLARLNADPSKHPHLDKGYRPPNLLRFLADNPAYDARLNSDLRALLTTMR